MWPTTWTDTGSHTWRRWDTGWWNSKPMGEKGMRFGCWEITAMWPIGTDCCHHCHHRLVKERVCTDLVLVDFDGLVPLYQEMNERKNGANIFMIILQLERVYYSRVQQFTTHRYVVTVLHGLTKLSKWPFFIAFFSTKGHVAYYVQFYRILAFFS